MKQLPHFVRHFLRQRSIGTAHLIRQLFVFPYPEPILSAVAGTGLENKVKFLDEFFRQSFACLINHQINTAEVIGSFNDIVHIDGAVLKADGIRFEDISGLIVGQSAPLHMVGVIG